MSDKNPWPGIVRQLDRIGDSLERDTREKARRTRHTPPDTTEIVVAAVQMHEALWHLDVEVLTNLPESVLNAYDALQSALRRS